MDNLDFLSFLESTGREFQARILNCSIAAPQVHLSPETRNEAGFRSNAPRKNFMSKIVTLLFLAAALLVCAPSTIRACSRYDFPTPGGSKGTTRNPFEAIQMAINQTQSPSIRLTLIRLKMWERLGVG